MKIFFNKILLSCAFLIFCVSAFAEDNNTAPAVDNGTIILQEIEVTAAQPVKNTTTVITQEEIESRNTTNLWELMRTIPGIVITGGGERNESNFRLRGFDASRVPVYIDGVSQILPYKGEADHARILTYDVESVEVQKGYSSMLMGANNLGGIISLNTAKPKKPFEASFRYGAEFDNIFKHQQDMYLASVGTRQDIFYGKAMIVYIDKSHFRLPTSFRPDSDYQPDHQRRDSYNRDIKLTLMGGVNPVREVDAHVTYVMQRAQKASPGDVTIRYPRIWDWTKWDRDSVSLNTSYTTSEFYVKGLAYYDNFRNRLYNERPHGIPGDYDDHSLLGRLTGGYDFNKRNKLEMAATVKWDKHDGYDNVTGAYTKALKIEEFIYSAGAEYSVNLFDPLTVVLGAGYDMLKPTEYWTAYRGSEDFKKADSQGEFVYQAGVFYDITQNHEVHATFSRKTHFPTMSDRFSSRYDVTIPNPALKPEWARHYEVGYTGYYGGRATASASVYFSDFRDKILQQLVRDPVTGQVITHSINKDRWNYYGFELSGGWKVNRYLHAEFMLSYNKSDNKFDTTVQDAYYPEFNSYGQLVITPNERLTVTPRFEYVGSRYVSTDASDNTRLPHYFLAHISARIDGIFKHYYIEAGIENIFDVEYEIKQFYPQPGRTFSVAVGGIF